MNKIILIVSLITIILTSCEKDKSGTGSDPDDEIIKGDTIESDVILRIGTSMIYDYNDVEIYDSSTHIFYFRASHPEFDKIKQVSFQFYVNEDTIYRGDFWPTYISALPTGPYIMNCPLMYQNYALRIDLRKNITPDPRNDIRLIQALKKRNLLHSGLLLSINTVEFSSNNIRFTFYITNMDQSGLLILDPDKTGPNLFHYFTNGLIIRKLPWQTATTVKIPYQAPIPYNSWNINWLSMISPGETKSFTINYPLDSPFGPGEYEVTFEYPGLSYQVKADQLYRDNVRIWLGDVTSRKNIMIN